MTYLDYVCIALCGLHILYAIYERFSFKRRVIAVCEKCGTPVSDFANHDCDLTSKQLEALMSFVISLKKGE